MMYPYDPLIKNISEFPNYQISENGEVYNKTTGLEMKPWDDPSGYLQVEFNRGKNKRNIRKIHRLLAYAFINNPDPIKNDEVDHIDKNRQNNKLENLRWCSSYENAQNQKLKSTNNSGLKGIIHYYRKDRKSDHWQAFITAYGNRSSKCFAYTDEGLELAKAWRAQKEKELFFKNIHTENGYFCIN